MFILLQTIHDWLSTKVYPHRCRLKKSYFFLKFSYAEELAEIKTLKILNQNLLGHGIWVRKAHQMRLFSDCYFLVGFFVTVADINRYWSLLIIWWASPLYSFWISYTSEGPCDTWRQPSATIYRIFDRGSSTNHPIGMETGRASSAQSTTWSRTGRASSIKYSIYDSAWLGTTCYMGPSECM